MKKYIEINSSEPLQEGDECRYVYSSEWQPNIHKSQVNGFEYRRPTPFEGKTAFLVAYAPVIRVVIDTTGLNEEEIDNKLIEAAKRRHCCEHQQYMNDFGDNIDWENTKEDTECPYVEEPQYRPFKEGDVIEEGDQVGHRGEWFPFNEGVYGEVINPQFVEDDTARKLIK